MKIRFITSSILLVLSTICVYVNGRGHSEEVIVPNSVEQIFWEAVSKLELGDESTFAEGRTLLRKSADKELAAAQYYLGICYRYGLYGFRKNNRRAVPYFSLAANQGDPRSMCHLGQLYYLGKGVRKDFSRATIWLEKSLDKSNDWTLLDASEILTKVRALPRGNSLDVVTDLNESNDVENLQAMSHYLLGLIDQAEGDVRKAQKHFMKATYFGLNGRAGVSDAAKNAAINYAYGRGVKNDFNKANDLLDLSSRLRQREYLKTTYRLFSIHVIDALDVASIGELLLEVNEERKQTTLFEIADDLSDKTSVDYNIKEAEKWLLIAAEDGDVWSGMKLAFIYFSDDLGQVDWEKSFKWFKATADNHLLAAGNLGICYQNGIGTPVDEKKAMQIFRKYKNENIVCYLGTLGKAPNTIISYDELTALCKEQAEQNPQAQYLMGVRYENGWGVKRSKRKANSFFKKAAKKDIAPALLRLGFITLEKRNSPSVERKALEYFKRSSDLGNAQAAFKLSFYSRLEIPGGTLSALEYAQLALRRDPKNIRYHFQVGQRYEDRIKYIFYYHTLEELYEEVFGESPTGTKEEAVKAINEFRNDDLISLYNEKIVFHYIEASKLNNGKAASIIANAYHDGDLGLKVDYESAYMYYQMAVDGGNIRANYNLGKMHEMGTGVPVTLSEASYYYRLAAADGLNHAMVDLGKMYLYGRGVDQNFNTAKKWFSMSSNSGEILSVLLMGDVLLEKKKYKRALKLFEEIMTTNIANFKTGAARRLAKMYFEGLGVDVDSHKAHEYLNYVLRKQWWRDHILVAEMCIDRGDFEEALRFLKEPFDLNYVGAGYQAARLYFLGYGELINDDLEAWTLIRNAALAGDNSARLYLSKACLSEKTGAPSISEALDYIHNAEAYGTPEAENVRRSLEDLLEIHHSVGSSSNRSQSG